MYEYTENGLIWPERLTPVETPARPAPEAPEISRTVDLVRSLPATVEDRLQGSSTSETLTGLGLGLMRILEG